MPHNLAKILSALPTSRTLILGGGVTGGALAEYLTHLGTPFTIYNDGGTVDPLASDWDLVLVSPGWKPNHETILALQAKQVPVISEIDLAWAIKERDFPQQRWIAVTGTNGKTTTIQMVESILQASQLQGIACGNVGKTVIEAITDGTRYDVLALELSSFQIEWMRAARFSAVAMLNIAEDHIDWHGSFTSYANAKMKLLAHSDLAVLNAADPEIVLRATSFDIKKIRFGLDTPQEGDLGLVEELFVDRAFSSDGQNAEVFGELVDLKPVVPHQALNAMAAAGVTLALGISHKDVRSGLQSFQPDHHRMEIVLEKDGLTWIDDSKATNPHAAQASLLSHFGVIWIAGGLAKGASMEELIQRVAERLKAVILIGEDRELIASALDKFSPTTPYLRIEKSGSAEELMDAVVREAKNLATPEDVILLAPACASMDQFTSYAHRGDCFTASVKKLA